jgi:hypothetical protein
MGAAYFIVLESEIDGLDTGMDGKSLSNQMEALDKAARELGVRPLSEFFSADPDQAAEFMAGEGSSTDDLAPPPLQQFSAQDGLNTVRALAAHEVSSADGVADDLKECERILAAAALHKMGWHFEIDF